MNYTMKKGKYVFEKDGVFFAMTVAQLKEMRDFCEKLISEEGDKNVSEIGEEKEKRVGGIVSTTKENSSADRRRIIKGTV